MGDVKVITTLCKEGKVEEAYRKAMEDYNTRPDDAWCQREVGWALYYQIKDASAKGNYANIKKYLAELKPLDLLNPANDNMIYDNVALQLASYIKSHMSPNSYDSAAKLSGIFAEIRNYPFLPNKGYSFLLQVVIKHDTWQELADFIDWWNLSNLREEDYKPYIINPRKQIMSVAEQAYIAKSKVLLRLNDIGRIEEFLPELDAIMESHPEYTYPGYFYGKLLIAIGGDSQNELKVVLPFARKKAGEFWVWDLLSNIYKDEPEKQLACLLRAVSCKTKETFLGKVRIKLAQIYIQKKMLSQAKYHIDIVQRTYLQEGWQSPPQIRDWARQGWLNSTSADGKAPIDFMTITNSIICEGTEESIAVVTYLDPKSNRASIIYGDRKRASVKLRFKVNAGVILKINYLSESEGHIKLLNAIRTNLPANLSYAKIENGTVKRLYNKEFAFFKCAEGSCFIPATVVKRYSINDRDNIKGLIVRDYDKNKDAWNWVFINKQ
jgi:hypothetical protein